MKISNYMNNTNLIVEKNNVKVQKENKQTNEKHTTEQAVKLSISNEGMEYYRNCIQQNRQETYDDVLQRRELLKSEKIRDIDYGYEISKKAETHGGSDLPGVALFYVRALRGNGTASGCPDLPVHNRAFFFELYGADRPFLYQ